MQYLKISAALALVVLMCLPSCAEDVNPNFREEAADAEFYHRAVKQLTDVIVHDIFSPPVAARIYSYSSIAGYEVMAAGNANYRSLAGQLTGLEAVPQPIDTGEHCYPVAALAAQLKVGKALIFSEAKMDAFEAELLEEIEAIKMPRAVLERSLTYGRRVADHIIEWSKGDMYAQTRTYPKFSINDESWR